MVTMVTHLFCESMGPRVTYMGALHPNPKFVCLCRLQKETTLNLRLTPYFNYEVLEIRQG